MKTIKLVVKAYTTQKKTKGYKYFSGALTVGKKDLSSYDIIILRRGKGILPEDEPLIESDLGKKIEFLDMEKINNFCRY